VTALILVTGVSGSGKSALSRELVRRDEQAVSLDAADGLCRWRDRAGRSVDRPDQPDLAWLRRHSWCWDTDVLDRMVAAERDSGVPRSFLCGSAANQDDFTDRFDVVVMLDIPVDVMLSRLDNTSRGNDFGRVGATRLQLIDRFASNRKALRLTADHIIDATAPIDQIADTLCALTADSSDGSARSWIRTGGTKRSQGSDT
jgi:hypothetical protein